MLITDFSMMLNHYQIVFKFALLTLNKNLIMKKIILTVAAVFALSFANAQDLKSKKGENFLPEAGDWSISFRADNLFNYVGNAFNGSGTNAIGSVENSNGNSSGLFTGKKFKTANQADRYSAGFELSNGSSTQGSNEISSTNITIKAGIGKEWRRGKTRLQGFYGYDLMAGLNLVNNEKTTTSAAVVEEKGGLGVMLGAQGFLGAEYFIFPKIAIGAQYTYGVNLNIAGAGSTTTTPTGGSSTSVDGAKSTSFGIGNVGVASMSLSLHF